MLIRMNDLRELTPALRRCVRIRFHRRHSNGNAIVRKCTGLRAVAHQLARVVLDFESAK